ncbi:MAG: sigma-54 dependent transcriptional regulator [Pseudomonadota bacterium]
MLAEIDSPGRSRQVFDAKPTTDRLSDEIHPEVVAAAKWPRPSGSSAAITAVNSLISRVAPFDATVLLLGESGTGKERVARSIHAQSNRRRRVFVPVNCGAIPPDLLESELFGHERGAFTGAVSRRKGRFELAAGGTLFLDEIGDMSLDMQVKLLRVLQERTYERVGGSETLDCDVRIVAATHRDLRDAVAEGRFRADLYYRLNVFPIDVPPLRDRCEDIPELAREIAAEHPTLHGKPLEFTAAALELLASYAWPGNVRELGNLIERLSILSSDGVIDDAALPAELIMNRSRPEPSGDALPPQGIDLRTRLAAVESRYIDLAMERADGVVADAARLLGIGRTTLVEKLRKRRLAA